MRNRTVLRYIRASASQLRYNRAVKGFNTEGNALYLSRIENASEDEDSARSREKE
jgi:hypothetical protein